MGVGFKGAGACGAVWGVKLGGVWSKYGMVWYVGVEVDVELIRSTRWGIAFCRMAS